MFIKRRYTILFMHVLMKFIIDALFPPQCVACECIIPHTHQFRTICDSCISRIEMRTGFTCAECGRRLPTLSLTCHPHFSNPEIHALIYALKFYFLKDVAIPLGSLLFTQFTHHFPGIPSSSFVCIPVPLHIARERERGFNQSTLIARALSSHFSPPLPLLDSLITRVTPTPSQATLHSHAERKRNIAGAFSINENVNLKDTIVIIVDDVVTSGATMHAVASTLRTKGARAIVGLAVAHA
jgi:ComF family protein